MVAIVQSGRAVGYTSQAFRSARGVPERRSYVTLGQSSLYGVADQFEHADSLDRRFDHNLRKVVNTDRNFSS